jgi:type II secretory ATPase GspE/PulE/Tfp pilus assembly ATPase PilB-like protein
MRNFIEVAEVSKPHRDIENVHLHTYSAAAGETAATILPKLIRTYPDVIVLRDVADLDTLTILCEQAANEDRLVVTSTRAKEAVEALLRLMMLKIPPADFAPGVTGVLNVRLVRKLCEKCKEAYPPPPEVLKQLGLPAGRIENLYRTPTQPIDPKKPDVVCDLCNGIGYFGRTGIFELLTVDDNIRKVLTTAPKLENLRLMARKLKHRSLQEEGVLLVARGVTSIQELLRVLKQ